MLRFFSALALIVTLSAPADAWGKIGHRVTGEIAEAYLSPEARQAIDELMGPESLAEASTWPDFMRASPEEFWKLEAGPYHYVTVPQGVTYADIGAPEVGDAVTALAKFSAILKDETAPQADRQLALRFIVHIVGDLHNPLHAGNGTDRGGNDFLVVFFDEVSNLHKVWDEDIINREQLSYTEWASWALPKITPELVADWWSNDPTVWIGESTALRDTVYPETRDLKWDYVFEHRETLRTQLNKGGVRIAAYLNTIFAD